MSVTGLNPANLVSNVVNPQANVIIRPGEESYNTAHLPKTLALFFRGEPEALGATQIFAGVFLFVCGIAIMIGTEIRIFGPQSVVFLTGLPIWSGVIYIICGSLSVAASVKPTLGKVRAILVMNILSSLAAASGMIMILVCVAIPSYAYREDQHCIYQPNEPCKGEFNVMDFINGVLSIFLLFTILMFCISITSSVFGCKTTCRTAFTEVNLVLYQVASDTTAEATPLPSTDPITIIRSSTESQDSSWLSHRTH